MIEVAVPVKEYVQDISHDTRSVLISAIRAKHKDFQKLLQPGQLKGIEHQRQMVETVELELGGILQALESEGEYEIVLCTT